MDLERDARRMKDKFNIEYEYAQDNVVEAVLAYWRLYRWIPGLRKPIDRLIKALRDLAYIRDPNSFDDIRKAKV